MYPVEYGGMGMNASSYAKVISRLSETWMSLAGIINTHMMLGQLILRFGTDGQKKQFFATVSERRTSWSSLFDRARCWN